MSDLLVVTDRVPLPVWVLSLRAHGHQVRVVSCRDGLIAELTAGQLDGVLIEHQGWTELLDGAPTREVASDARLLVIAEPSDLIVRTDLDALGVDDLVCGPVDPVALRRRVRRRFPAESLVASEL
ncbi:MAG: hypothetical protein GY713_06290 [Actinomycetia bacterium]|nr:hypothetical protein [Actinomycetes bacterium]MCP3910543.1 hypothetical protein [Actinomycetes bacterium]